MERAPDFIADLKLQTQTSPQLDAHLDDIRRRFPEDENGVPKIPHLSAEQTQQYLQRCVRIDIASRDAGARSADVAARNIAKGRAGIFSQDWASLKTLPSKLQDIAMPAVPPAANVQAVKEYDKSLVEVRRQAGKLFGDLGVAVDEHCSAYDRSMAGPTDAQRTRAGNEATAAFFEPSNRDPRITFGMSQVLSSQEQQKHIELDDRFKAVERVNRYLDYGRSNDRNAERAELSQVHADTLAKIPEQLDSFYASSRFGTLNDGFEQKAKVSHEQSVVERALTHIQRRDGIANDGSFKLPMLDERQSSEWLARCERMDAALTQATQRGLPAERARAGLAEMTSMPRALESIEKSNLAPEQQRERVDRLLAQSAALDVSTQAAGQNLAPAATTKSFGDRMQAAWNRMKSAVGNLNPFRSSALPAPASIQPTPGETVRGLDAASFKAVRSAHLENELLARAGVNRAQSSSLEERIVVSSGEVGHETSKGTGFTAMGTVEGVKHAGDAVEIDYAVHGHHFDVKIDEKDPAGRALGHAAEDLKTGDSFKLAIGHDRDGKAVAQLEDHTTGHSVTVDRSGHVDEHDHADLSKSRQKGIGR